MLGIDKHRP